MPENLKNKDLKVNEQKTADIENVLVINTKDKFDVETFGSYKTMALLTSNSIALLDNNGKITINSLAKVDNLILNREKIVGFINMARPFFVYVYPVVFVGAYLIGLIVVSGKLIYLLFGALFIWIVAKIKGLKIGYKKSYQLGMHLMTFAILATSLLTIISPKLVFPYLFTILVILSASINLKKNAVENEALVL